MSNIAGKAYAMNVITPIKWYWRPINKFIFWLIQIPFFTRISGLVTLSLIHYARWVIMKPSDFPRLSSQQPEEELQYSYMLFMSNFNGSWDQYVDSFHTAIPAGLDLFWLKNVGYPKSSPLEPFHQYITHNRVWTDHYYSAYPMASSNDIKSAQKVKSKLIELSKQCSTLSPEAFQQAYNKALIELQHDISEMKPTPIVSLAAENANEHRQQNQAI